MSARREVGIAVFVVAMLGAGIGFELVTSDVTNTNAMKVEGERFMSRAVFCPPAVGDNKVSTVLAIGSADGTDATIGMAPEFSEPKEVGAQGLLMQPVAAGDPRKEVGDDSEVTSVTAPVEVVGFGSSVVATAITSSDSGVGATPCATRASPDWYFAAGSASIDTSENILLYNPFPDEAVVALALFTPGGEQTSINLDDVSVPAHEFRSIEINNFIQVKKTIAVMVSTRRGRVVAWREMATIGKDKPDGVDYALGAPAPAQKWFFPDGAVGQGATETLSILNPGNEEATVNVVIATPVETLSPPDLVEFPVPPRSQRVIVVEDFAGGNKNGIASVSATVTSVNGEPIIVERTMSIDTETLRGQSSEVGMTKSASTWFLGPASIAPTNDSVIVMAPGGEDAVVDLKILQERGEPIEPPELQGLRITAGSRIKVPIADWTGGGAFAVVVTSNNDVVAERFSYSAGLEDISSVMGQPIKMLP